MSFVSIITSRGQITIPAHIRKLLELSAGRKVVISYTDKALKIQPIPEMADVMSLYASVKSKGKLTSAEKVIAASKKIKAKRTAKQLYE
jgi:AbrB family looped-hinge helix DNA binding protein